MGKETEKKPLSDFKLSLWNYIVIGCKGIFGDGMSSIVAYVLGLFNKKVLSRCPAEELKKWSGVFRSLMVFVSDVVEIFVTEEAVRLAAGSTTEVLGKLASHLEDGNYSEEELDADIEAVYAAIENWKRATSK